MFSYARLLACMIPALIVGAVNASTTKVYQGISKDAIYDICMIGEVGYAVGNAGVLLESQDAGHTWNNKKLNIQNTALLGITCLDDGFVAVGQSGKIILNNSSGQKIINSPTEERLFSVSDNGNGFMVSVGAFGNILASKDSGISWHSINLDWYEILNDYADPHLYDVEIVNDLITIVGEFGLILQSRDFGENWTVANKGSASLFNLHFTDDNTAYAVGQNGTLLKSSDSGASWTSLGSVTNSNLLGVVSTPANEVFVSGIRTLLYSNNGGITWQSVSDEKVNDGWFVPVFARINHKNSLYEFLAGGYSGMILSVQPK